MALVIIMILLVFGLGIVGNLFSTLNPFVEKLGDVTNYNTAYYAAAMSAERWLLALRYHDAGFEWQSGIKSGHNSDVLVNTLNFWKFTAPTSDGYWKISSIVSRSPELGKGNVEPLYAWTDSKNYNVLWYNETIYIPLYKDTTSNTGEYYTAGTTESLFGDSVNAKIIWTFRLPAGVRTAFITQWGWWAFEGLLDDGIGNNTNWTGDIDEDGIDDDIILQRWVEWYSNDEKFTIQPTIKNSFNDWKPEYNYDNAIRETIINDATSDASNLIDSSSIEGFSFLADSSIGSDIDKHNILPLNSSVALTNFGYILRNASYDINWLTLSFSITNLMKTKENQTYPFLEWYFGADENWPIPMPDRFYTLDAVWTINNYTVRFQIKKPVKENSNVSNFTIIF